MSPSNTTIILVPGAWHTADCFTSLSHELEKSGYSTDLVTLPSVGHDKRLPNFTQDVDTIRSRIQEAANAGRDVVLVGHSYGSIPSGEACQGLLKRDAAAGKGGVTHLFFLAAFVIPEGASLIGAFGGSPLPWFVISDDELEVNPATPEEIFYNDLEASEQQRWIGRLKPQSYRVMHTPVTYAAWKEVPCTYLYCTLDQAIPLQIQKMMVEGTAEGCGFRTESVEAGHCPFLSKTKETAEAIVRAAEERAQ